jgi:hypothetical protein
MPERGFATRIIASGSMRYVPEFKALSEVGELTV